MSASISQKYDEVTFTEIIETSAFGPRFSGDAYAEDGNIVTLRTTDISVDGTISYQEAPRARLDETKFENHFLQVGDLVITRSGRVGTTAVFEGHPDPVLPGAFLIRFRLQENADPNFYRYWFNSPVGQNRLLSVARGAAQQNINITNVKKIKVLLPPIQAQRHIADILSSYDDLIENNRHRIDLLAQSARLLHKEWFVSFRFPGHEHVKVKDGAPHGWEKTTLGEIAPLTYGKALKADERIPGDYPVYGSSGIVGTHEKALAKGPGIIVGRKGNAGSAFWSMNDFYPIDTTYYIDSSASNYFLYYLLLNTQFVSSDVAVPGLNRDYAHSLKINLPSKHLLSLFEETVSPIHKQIYTLENYTQALTRARDLLLPRLMNGEIPV